MTDRYFFLYLGGCFLSENDYCVPGAGDYMLHGRIDRWDATSFRIIYS